MPSRRTINLLQGTLDLMVLRVVSTMGPLHAYGIASRIEQIAGDALRLNQGTLYPALIRLEQRGWLKAAWRTTENKREAKYYSVTKAGARALGHETERWRAVSGLVEKVLLAEA